MKKDTAFDLAPEDNQNRRKTHGNSRQDDQRTCDHALSYQTPGGRKAIRLAKAFHPGNDHPRSGPGRQQGRGDEKTYWMLSSASKVFNRGSASSWQGAAEGITDFTNR